MAISPTPPAPKDKQHDLKLNVKKKIIRKKHTCLKYKNNKAWADDDNKAIICHDSKEVVVSFKAKSQALERAEDVKASLPSEFPSFVKSMLPSHIAGGFWLSFPKGFCDSHLPRHDATVILVDENEYEYQTKYLVEKNGLSAGWRGFSIAHKLLEGDALVFQLVKPCRFMVYIVRINSLNEIDGAIGLLALEGCTKPRDIDQMASDTKALAIANEKCLELLPLDSQQNDSVQDEKKEMMVLGTDLAPAIDQSGNESDNHGSEVLQGIRFSDSVIHFKDVKSIEDFNIFLDGLIIDSEIPRHLRLKYYELCCSQRMYLHDHLLEGLNCKLAAGVISETVNIADALRACNLSTPNDTLTTWERTLKAFEELGMQVGFLRLRLKKLVSLSFESREVINSKRLERLLAEEDIKALEIKLFNLKEGIKALDAEIEALNLNGERLARIFQETASAPW